MKTTGVFTTHSFKTSFTQYNEVHYLLPFGDVHWGNPLCDRGRWREFLKWAKEKPRSYFIGMGDYFDLMSTSERHAIENNHNVHDSTENWKDSVLEAMVKEFYEEIKFMKGRLIGLLEGNHYATFMDGSTTTQRLCQYMECKYLGVMSHINFRMYRDKNHSTSVDIMAHHGVGGGRTMGASINNVEKMTDLGLANIYLMGHDHHKIMGLRPLMMLCDSRKGTLRRKPYRRFFGRTGSFLMGYVDGKASYIADSALPPTDLGTVKIELTPRRDYEDNSETYYIDIHGSI